jgi:hypothetical protein
MDSELLREYDTGAYDVGYPPTVAREGGMLGFREFILEKGNKSHGCGIG